MTAPNVVFNLPEKAFKFNIQPFQSYDKDNIQAFLIKSDLFVVKSLMLLYNLQTDNEQNAGTSIDNNGVGFNKLDAKILTSIAMQCKRTKHITSKQLNLCRSKLMKYAKQISKVANSELSYDIMVHIKEQGVF